MRKVEKMKITELLHLIVTGKQSSKIWKKWEADFLEQVGFLSLLPFARNTLAPDTDGAVQGRQVPTCVGHPILTGLVDFGTVVILGWQVVVKQ